ncbi:hypothetical protein GmHk_02G005173 [Glycine max]|nr:hypothetical protein GmHk_02G005173 [Glycine max]
MSIANLLGFRVGITLFDYLGVLVFKGKPSKTTLQPLADKIGHKLGIWKGHLLSLMGHVQLVK